LAAREVVEPRELGVGETFVVAEVKIGLRAVIQHINFAMLIRRHRAGIHIEVGIELLHGDFEAAIFEQCAERGSREALAERTDHTACDKDKFHVFRKELNQ
jgi:hypothetical protein